MAKILLVEDELDLSGAVTQWLADEYHLVEHVSNGNEALEKLAAVSYDLILLDWMLPGLSGIDVCKAYRKQGGIAPVIMLTAKKSLLSKEVGLDSGADDYLTKPFHLRELSARIRALLRRPQTLPVSLLRAGNLTLDRANLAVRKDNKPVHLSPKEFALLELLMRHEGKALSAEFLLEQVWGTETDVVAETLRSNIKTLRKKIDDHGQESLIHTVHGIGYKIETIPVD